MKKFLVVVLIVLAAIAVFFIAKPMGGDELDGLGGEPWTLVNLEADGKKLPPKQWAGMRVQFAKESVIWTVLTEEGPQDLEGGFGHDPNKKTKQIDLNHPFAEKAWPGIYKIEDGELTISISPGRRPSDFSGKGQMRMTFQRK